MSRASFPKTSEVHNERTAEAAKEIKTLIQDSVGKVEHGSQLVNDSGHTLEDIVASVKKVTDIVAEIAAASAQQSSGIEQVNKSVIQMDGMTQQNAALVEQAAAATQSLSDQAQRLNTMLAKYIVRDHAEASPAMQAGLPKTALHPAGAPKAAPPAARQPARQYSARPPKVAALRGGADADWTKF
jgi:methyl-accepting chemotaxis protein